MANHSGDELTGDLAAAPERLREVLDLARTGADCPVSALPNPELAHAVRRQRRVSMLLESGGPAVPDTLRRRVEAIHAERRPVRPRVPAVRLPLGWPARTAGLVGVVAAVVAVLVVLTTSVGSGSVPATRVANAWTLPATSTMVTPNAGDSAVLEASFHGTAYPNYRDNEGWHAVGTRADPIDGKPAFTVYYATGDRRASYTVVAGTHVTVPADAHRLVAGGVHMSEFRDGDRWIVVFPDHGNSCVLTAAAPREKAWLVKLAAWGGSASISA